MTQDADFVDRVKVQGAPPKVIWLRTGNTSTKALAALLRRHAKFIHAFLNDPDLDWTIVP